MITIQLKYFGAFRDLAKQSTVPELRFNGPVCISDVKIALAEEIRKRIGNSSVEQLIQDSAIADDDQVLTRNHRVDGDCTLLLLPPVCGG